LNKSLGFKAQLINFTVLG